MMKVTAADVARFAVAAVAPVAALGPASIGVQTLTPDRKLYEQRMVMLAGAGSLASLAGAFVAERKSVKAGLGVSSFLLAFSAYFVATFTFTNKSDAEKIRETFQPLTDEGRV